MLGCCLPSVRAAAPIPPERTISRKILSRFQSIVRAKSRSIRAVAGSSMAAA